MPPIAFPTPIPGFVKGAWNYFTSPHPSYYEELLQYLENRGTTDQWRHLYVRYHNLASGATAADDFFVTFDITNITAGQPDSTWTTSDYTTCEALFDTYFGTTNGNCPSWLRITEYRWYVREFGALGDKPFVDHGPPVRSQTKSMTGGSATLNGAQQALSITERTAWARHWGRFYLPSAVAPANGVAGGRITSTFCDTMATAYQTLVAGLASADFQMVVPVTQIDKTPVRDLLTVSSIQVDDILDVVRSRRPRNPLVRSVKP